MSKTIHRREYLTLIRQLREARHRAGLTQADLARAVGKRQTWISDIEIGTRRIDVIELRDLCQGIGVDFVRFLGQFERSTRIIGRR